MAHGDSIDPDRYKLRLFITGSTPRSMRALENLQHVCSEELRGRYELEVIDVYQHPEATREYRVIATPTLVRVLPHAMRRISGDLSDRRRVFASLELPRPSN